jgi:hypothetical protein
MYIKIYVFVFIEAYIAFCFFFVFETKKENECICIKSYVFCRLNIVIIQVFLFFRRENFLINNLMKI